MALLACPAILNAQFSAGPVILTLSSADSSAVQVVNVRNEGKAEEQFRFFLLDFDQDGHGNHRLQLFGKNAASCQGRMSIFPTTATVLPGERQAIRVTMQPGATVCWSLLMIEKEARAETGIRAMQQIAVKVYGVPPKSSLTGDIDSVTARQDSAGVHVEFQFRNTGQAPLRPQGTVEIRTLTGEVVATTPVDAFSTLPAHALIVTAVLPKHLASGHYLAVPILDFGTDFLVGGQGQLTIP